MSCVILIGLLFLLVVELSNQAISILPTLVTSLILLLIFILVENWVTLDIVWIIVLDYEDSAANFDDVVYFECMQGTDFAFCT